MEQVLELELQHCLMNSIIHSAELAYRTLSDEATAPHVLLRPSVSIDGNQWCALYGENLQDGIAGFGDSPYKAMQDFDAEYYKALPKQPSNVEDVRPRCPKCRAVVIPGYTICTQCKRELPWEHHANNPKNAKPDAVENVKPPLSALRTCATWPVEGAVFTINAEAARALLALVSAADDAVRVMGDRMAESADLRAALETYRRLRSE